MTVRSPAALAAFSTAALVLAMWTPSTASPRCTVIQLEWLQADTAGWVIAVATGDSAIGATRERPALRDGTRRSGLDVYGQWATVERSSDPRDVGRRALFVWWNTGSLCEPLPSGRALARAPGTRFFAGASLRDRDGRGVAIHDIASTTPTYLRAWVGRDSARALTVDEYATFYEAMPSRKQWFADPVTHTRRIRRWARANPALATREPVLGALEMMETDYAIDLADWRREGRWPHDSLIQAPGLLLRAGMQLLYKGDNEQLWTIDALTPDTTIAGIPHCAHLRLRTSPQAPAGTRVFCAREGMLHTWHAASAQLRRARPLLPDSRLTIPGANGTTTLFVTDSLYVELVDGRAVEVIGTTVTTSDSTGRVVRRLREKFAPALLTATEGAFEVPDSTESGAWRVVTRFRLAEIRQGSGR